MFLETAFLLDTIHNNANSYGHIMKALQAFTFMVLEPSLSEVAPNSSIHTQHTLIIGVA